MEGGNIPSKVGEMRIMQTTPAIYQTLIEQATTSVPLGGGDGVSRSLVLSLNLRRSPPTGTGSTVDLSRKSWVGC